MLLLIIIISTGFILSIIIFLYLRKLYKNVLNLDLSLKERVEILAVKLFQYFKRKKIILNYSIESIKILEEFIKNNFDNKIDADNLNDNQKELVVCIGAYLAETIRKILKGNWVASKNKEIDLSYAVMLLKNKNTIWPFQKVFKRIMNGEEDNIYHYILLLKKE